MYTLQPYNNTVEYKTYNNISIKRYICSPVHLSVRNVPPLPVTHSPLTVTKPPVNFPYLKQQNSNFTKYFT